MPLTCVSSPVHQTTLFRNEKLRHREVQQLLHPCALLARGGAVIPTVVV